MNLIDTASKEEEKIIGVEEETEEFQPFDPDKISIDTKSITMDTCLRRLEQGTIVLAPDFQRNEVWTTEKKCRLIESLMLKIPIPMFYVSADEKGVFSVVDGLQRLSTIRSFILGDTFLKTKEIQNKGEGFILAHLEFWGRKFDGLNFNELPINIQNRILETEFTFTIINPGTPEEVKRNIFKRINTGGEPLTAQEIRHALYIGESTNLLMRLSKRNEFQEAITRSVKSNRMLDRELILRFLAFSIRDYSTYSRSGDMDSFLSDTMRLINIMPDLNGKDANKLFKNDSEKKQILVTDISVLEEKFILAMRRSQQIFGKHTFRKSYGDKGRTQINKALFEAWSVLLSKIKDEQFENLKKNLSKFMEEYTPYLDNLSFNNAVSRDAIKFTGVKYRYDELTKLLNKYI